MELSSPTNPSFNWFLESQFDGKRKERSRRTIDQFLDLPPQLRFLLHPRGRNPYGFKERNESQKIRGCITKGISHQDIYFIFLPWHKTPTRQYEISTFVKSYQQWQKISVLKMICDFSMRRETPLIMIIHIQENFGSVDEDRLSPVYIKFSIYINYS